jgi:hypothetical protein
MVKHTYNPSYMGGIGSVKLDNEPRQALGKKV